MAAFVGVKPAATGAPRPIANVWQAVDSVNEAQFAELARAGEGKVFANVMLPK